MAGEEEDGRASFQSIYIYYIIHMDWKLHSANQPHFTAYVSDHPEFVPVCGIAGDSLNVDERLYMLCVSKVSSLMG